MNNHQRKSLGSLSLNQKRTKPKSPAMLGSIKLQRHHLDVFLTELENEGDAEITANLAAWKSRDDAGNPYLVVELQPRWNPQRQHQSEIRQSGGTIFDYPREDEE